jgi:hypothetical protein
MAFNVSLATNSAGFDQGTERPFFVHKPSSNCSVRTYIKGNTTSCIDTTAYALPVAPTTVNAAGVIAAYNYAYGNTSRNTLHGPGFNFDNLSLFKNVPVWERGKLQLRAEAFNVTNHPSAANPNSSNGTGNPSLSAASQSSTTVSPAGFGQVIDMQKVPGELSGLVCCNCRERLSSNLIVLFLPEAVGLSPAASLQPSRLAVSIARGNQHGSVLFPITCSQSL